MHYSTIILTAAAFAQGVLSGPAGISTFSGPNCSGNRYDVKVESLGTVTNIPAFQSYRENGWGESGQRLAFFPLASCGDVFLYDTWAYNGDYFKSKTCYNIYDHAKDLNSGIANKHYARCVDSRFQI